MTRSSVNNELTLFSYEILGLVGRGGAGAHDLLRMAQRGRILAWAGESQYYVEPKRLAMLGYLEARKEPGKTRERTVYTLTEKGLDALREWVRTPVSFTPFKSEALLRALATDLEGEEAGGAGVGALRGPGRNGARDPLDRDRHAHELVGCGRPRRAGSRDGNPLRFPRGGNAGPRFGRLGRLPRSVQERNVARASLQRLRRLGRLR